MSRRKAPYQKKPFESTGASSDTSANIYVSMLLSDAWKDLTANQQRLYIYCKTQYYAERNKPGNDSLAFTMNQAKWADLYGLYKKNNAAAFYRDIEALIEHGFIVCKSCGALTRTKSVYQFSAKWQQWGRPCFEVLTCEMTLAMQRKRRKEKV